MKKIIIILVLISSFESLACKETKDIIGIWQLWDSLVTAGYKARYEFYKDSSFKYFTSEYSEDNKLVSISGKYKLKNDSLILNIDDFSYSQGSMRIGDSDIEDSNPWVYNIDSITKQKCKSDCDQKAHISFNLSKNKKKITSIDVNGFQFFKIKE